ncbi:MAG TPA: hypothetical protein PKB08_13925, partial [Burkholderiaceae bacterium]|nr:hypothetical protein [Burkholderiaceae bacterium]
LHEVRDGPASRSYGLQVARLAGLPPAVIRAASQLLGELESRARAHDDQLDLFAMPQGPASDLAGLVEQGPGAATPAPTRGGEPDRAMQALARLREIDPDALSAREALDLLYELRAQVDEDTGAPGVGDAGLGDAGLGDAGGAGRG